MGTQDEAKTNKATVVVGCRYPHGVILRLCDMVDTREVMSGGRSVSVKVAQPRGKQVTLRGYSNRQIPVAVDSRGEYGVTPDVPADFFAEWLKQNAESDLVKNRIIFAADSEAELKAMGKDFKDERNGLEPMDPKKPGVRGITPASIAEAAA